MNIDCLTRRIEGTFQLFFIWIKQNADSFINGNNIERALVICQSDQKVRSSLFELKLFDALFLAIINQ